MGEYRHIPSEGGRMQCYLALPAQANGGATQWTEKTTGFTGQLNKVHIPRGGVFDSQLWTAGFGGMIMHGTASGATWTQQGSGVTTQTLNSINTIDTNGFPNAVAGFAVGQAGTIVYTTNGGTTWAVHPDSAITTRDLPPLQGGHSRRGHQCGSRHRFLPAL